MHSLCIDTIIPEASKPIIVDAPLGGGYLPAACNKSARLMPDVDTLMRISPLWRVGNGIPGVSTNFVSFTVRADMVLGSSRVGFCDIFLGVARASISIDAWSDGS